MTYPNRYELEPRKRKPYEVACDLIAVYGATRKQFNYKLYGINRREMKEIWNTAERDMSGKSRVCYCCYAR